MAMSEAGGRDRAAAETGVDAARTQARAAVEELHEIAGRIVSRRGVRRAVGERGR